MRRRGTLNFPIASKGNAVHGNSPSLNWRDPPCPSDLFTAADIAPPCQPDTCRRHGPGDYRTPTLSRGKRRKLGWEFGWNPWVNRAYNFPLSCGFCDGRKNLKSLGPQGLCGFDSRPPHHYFLGVTRTILYLFPSPAATLGNDFGKRRSILSTAVPRFSPLRWA